MEQKKKIGEKIGALLERAKTDKKFLALLCGIAVAIIAIIAVVVILIVGGNGGNHGNGGTGNGEQNQIEDGPRENYYINIKTQGGMALAGLDVYVYADEGLTSLINFSSTNAEGSATFSLVSGKEYYVAISSDPKKFKLDGYNVQASYKMDSTVCNIELVSSLITDGNLSDATLGVGNVMYDFTVTTTDGENITLSELLAEKELVVLNFWYTTCSWCMTEFPLMAEAYDMYKDDVAIIALDPLDGEALVNDFQSTNQLPFYVAACNNSFATAFNVTGYPTSVFIDRYGVICAVEPGAITSLRPFVSVFEHFTADEYEQKLCANGVADLVTQVKPTETMPESEEIEAIIKNGDFEVTFRPETEDDSAEYAWPFIIGEKNGEQCIYASNKGIEDSFAIIYADVYLEAGQALALDYLASTERGCDIMYVIVDGQDIYAISGNEDVETWKSCYPVVATTSGYYEVALCYLKDSDINEGDDTVYIKNMRIVSEADIDVDTYLPREAAVSEDGFDYSYVDIVYNAVDGYYHVGSTNGPLLLANLMNYSEFSEENSLYELLYEEGSLIVNGEERYEDFVVYCQYASNANIYGVCTVNLELAEMLKAYVAEYGFDDDENEWLKFCYYYEAFGKNVKQLEDPIKGLAPFSAFKATLGTNVSTNYFYYDRAIMPRGMLAEFVPTVSGVYRITCYSDSEQGTNGWLFNENREVIYTYEHDERMFEDNKNCSIVFYMEAGTPYYINFAFWDVYEVGVITYDITYIGASHQHFRAASPGYFTYDPGATGDEMYYVIAGGIDVVLGTDGYYYEDLGKDANGNQVYGSVLYADFTGLTGIFGNPIVSNSGVTGMIDMGGFDFSKSENDLYILAYLNERGGDVEATDAYLRELWGEDYEAYAEEYQIDDVYKGRYHGDGEDLTAEIKNYISKMDASGNTERNGCVMVDERLAEILQMLMDKYTFQNVENSWIKLCYYYDYLGPEN